MSYDSTEDRERRGPRDRRRRPTGPLDSLRFRGRRATVRRDPERNGPYFLDRFGASTLAWGVALLGLTLADGLLTLHLLDAHCEEINPLMAQLLTRGPMAFLLGKYLLTAAGLPFLVVYGNHPLFGTRRRIGLLLPAFVALYLALVGYQGALIAMGARP